MLWILKINFNDIFGLAREFKEIGQYLMKFGSSKTELRCCTVRTALHWRGLDRRIDRDWSSASTFTSRLSLPAVVHNLLNLDLCDQVTMAHKSKKARTGDGSDEFFPGTYSMIMMSMTTCCML